MQEILQTMLAFVVRQQQILIAVGVLVLTAWGSFTIGRATKKPEVREVVVWKYHTEGRRSIKGQIDNLLRPVIEKGK